MSWKERAACRGADPEIFVSDAHEEQAKAICRMCPVIADCYEYAIRIKEQFGIWGGLNPRERRRLAPSGRIEYVYS